MVAEIAPFSEIVRSFLDLNKEHLNEHPDRIDLEQAYQMKDRINRFSNEMQKLARNRLTEG